MEAMVELLEKYRGKKVYITGHTGFKGAWLSYLLDKHGAIVKGYALQPNTKPSLFEKIVFSSNFSSEFSNILDNKKFKDSIVAFQPDYIFHMAAQPLVIDSYHDPAATFSTNVLGTLNLLEIIRKSEIEATVVIITTDKVYENLELNRAFEEEDKLGGHDPYSASKAAAEIVSHSYKSSFFQSGNTRIATARAGNVIGGGDWSKDRLIPDIIRSFVNKEKLEIRNPHATRPWQHVLEPLNGYLKLALAIEREADLQGGWNFGPEIKDVASVKDIVETTLRLGFVTEVEYTAPKFHEAKFLQLNNAKAKQINWSPVWSAQESIELTLQWYKGYYEGVSITELIDNDLKQYEKDER